MDVERIFMMNNCGAEFGAARCVDCLFPVPEYEVYEEIVFFKVLSRASLVVQWLRICLPMQRTQV